MSSGMRCAETTRASIADAEFVKKLCGMLHGVPVELDPMITPTRGLLHDECVRKRVWVCGARIAGCICRTMQVWN